MRITSDHISESSRALIRSASQAELERVLRRAERTHRFLVIAFVASALAALGLALATRKLTWALVVPWILFTVMARRRRGTEADLLKIAVNPDLIHEIRKDARPDD